MGEAVTPSADLLAKWAPESSSASRMHHIAMVVVNVYLPFVLGVELAKMELFKGFALLFMMQWYHFVEMHRE